MKTHQNVILLDFSEQDTIQLLENLLQMAAEQKVSGMVFAVLVPSKRKHKILLGSTGRLERNAIEAAGLAAMLQCSLTKAAMSSLSNGD